MVTSASVTLNATHHTTILTGTSAVVTLSAPATCERRMYIIVNQTATPRTISSYFSFIMHWQPQFRRMVLLLFRVMALAGIAFNN
ncbi:MAG: hypothetical protein IPI23_16585 [Bacteroidetes bacterium]|nr:hypothetical protein [Bacteroidota bacterium]